MLGYLWDWFQEISYDREMSFGLGYIKSSEYESWARLHRVKISFSEIAVLKRLDREFIRSQNPDAAPEPSFESGPSPLMKSLRLLAESHKKGGAK